MIFVVPLSLAAQEPTTRPAFEVASVKPNKSGTGLVGFGMQPGGRYTATNTTTLMLIRQAYQLQLSQIVGAPDWLSSDHFDVVAKAPGDVPPAQIQLMIRALLEERFKLAAHNETRDLEIYALVMTRNDGKPGPQLRPTTVDCAAFGRGRGGAPPPGGPAAGGQGLGGRGGPAAPVTPGGPPPCRQMVGPANITASGMTMAQLATTLSMRVGRTVVDRTGLTGSFDLDLSWTPDQMPQMPPGALPPGAPPLPPIDPNGPSLFTAVQEQLGLKLESTKGPVEVLVIDSVEHPTED